MEDQQQQITGRPPPIQWREIVEESYYSLLQVAPHADPDVIRAAYRVLVRKHHPDLLVSASREEGEEFVKLLNEAYGVLTNPSARAEYDGRLADS